MTLPFLEQYRACFDADVDATTSRSIACASSCWIRRPPASIRRTDRLVTIGAVAVLGGEIVLEDSFSALLQVDRNTEAVTVHGVTRDEARKGVPEPEALAGFSTICGTA